MFLDVLGFSEASQMKIRLPLVHRARELSSVPSPLAGEGMPLRFHSQSHLVCSGTLKPQGSQQLQ